MGPRHIIASTINGETMTQHAAQRGTNLALDGSTRIKKARQSSPLLSRYVLLFLPLLGSMAIAAAHSETDGRMRSVSNSLVNFSFSISAFFRCIIFRNGSNALGSASPVSTVCSRIGVSPRGFSGVKDAPEESRD